MKRTKETYFRYHPDWQNREGISGCREFDGEDLKFDSRLQYNKQQQKRWLEEQMYENEMKRRREMEEDRLYAEQTLANNRMRGMLEDQFLQQKSNIRWDNRENNLSLAKEKKDKNENSTQQKMNYEKSDLANMTLRGQKQNYP